MKTAEQHGAALAELCPHSKLVDEKFQRVTLKLECRVCRVYVVRKAMGEAAGDMRERAEQSIQILIGNERDPEWIAAFTVAIAGISALAIPASAKGGDDKEGDK